MENATKTVLLCGVGGQGTILAADLLAFSCMKAVSYTHLDVYKRQILACTPSYALLIADTAIEMGYDPATEFQISGGIFGAEPCSENMRQEIADKLGIQYCDVYGLSLIHI